MKCKLRNASLVLPLSLLALTLLAPLAAAISFNEDVCFTKNGIDICFKSVDVYWNEKKVLKYEFEKGKVINIVVSPIPITDRVYVYLKDDAYYQFDTGEIPLDEVQSGSYDVKVKVIDQSGKTRVDFDLYNDAGYTLYVEKREKEKVRINLENVEGVVGKPVSIVAKVSSEYGGVANVKLDFYVNGTFIGTSKTDTGGKAVLKYTPEKSGVFDIKVVFKGNDYYEGCNATAKLTVMAAATTATTVTTTPATTATPAPTATAAKTVTTVTTAITVTTVTTTPAAETQTTPKKTPGFEVIPALMTIASIAFLETIRRRK